MTKELNEYYKEVRRCLLCSKGEKDRLIAQAHRMVEDLLLDRPDAGYDDVVAFLGEPRELANTFMERMDPAAVASCQKKKRRIRISLIALVVAVIVALSIFSIYVVKLKSEVHFTREDTLIIREYVDRGADGTEEKQP